MTVEFLRTPDARFDNLPGYSYAPHYIDNLQGYEGLRVHYVDEGPGESDRTFLCLHGQPTWSYLYRKMIPVFLEAGGRVIAPDWLGFGRSDKPVDEEVYTYNFHREMMINLIIRLDLRNITLVCQDWGGLLGLPIVPDMPERFTRLIVMNTTIAVGESPGDGFDSWKAFNRSQQDLAIAALMQRSTPSLSEAEAAAYDAPYPDQSYKSGVRRFPELVMVEPDMQGVDVSQRAVRFWSERWEGESFMAVGMQDPVLGPAVMADLRKTIRNCPPPMEIAEGGHFVQEHGEQIARAALQRWGDL